MATASQAEALREKLYVEYMTEAGYTINKETLAADALAMKQALNAAARGGIGPFTTVRRQDAGVYSTNLSGSQQFIKDYLEERHGKKKAAPTTSGGPAPDPRQGGGEGGIPQSTPSGDSDGDGGSDASQSAGLSRDNESDGGYSPGGTGGGRSDYQGGYSGFTSQGPTDGYGGGSMGGRAMGGRVGMQAGGVAAQPPALWLTTSP